MKLYAVVHIGYDYSDKIVAVCDDLTVAKELADEEMKKPSGLHFPWNYCIVAELEINERVDFGKIDVVYNSKWWKEE